MKNFHFFAFLSRMKYINRWGLMRNTLNENIMEHSLSVAMIAHGLCVIKNTYFDGKVNAERAAILAVYHDSNEILTGDLPTPVKYFNPRIKEAYREVEGISSKKLLSLLPEELQKEYEGILFRRKEEEELWRIVKAADKISAYLKCVEEIKAGNSEFVKAAESTLGLINKDATDEVRYFMDHFAPSYSLTLDELDS